MKKRTRKHHYLPRHYLRGFVNADGGFFVYDKQRDTVFPSSPNDAFFENDLNTVTLPTGTKSDFLEALYTGVENQSWSSFDRISNSTPDTPINLVDKMSLFLFLSYLHWRQPCNADRAEELSQRFFGPDNTLSYFKLMTKTGGSVPEPIVERLRTSRSWRKAAKAVVPFAPFFAGNAWVTELENWRFLYTSDDKKWYIVGDNPIITRGKNDHDPTACLREFIFPVSGRILAVSFGGNPQRALPPAFGVEYGAAIIQRAHRFVACQDRAFLEALVNYHHKVYVAFDKTDIVISELFAMLGKSGAT